MEKKRIDPAGSEAVTAEMACVAGFGGIQFIGPLQFRHDALLMPVSAPFQVALDVPQVYQELGSHVSDPSLVHPGKSSFGGCLGEFTLQKPWLICWFVARSQAEPLLEFLLGHICSEGPPSICVLVISAPHLPRLVGQRCFDRVYTLALPVKASLLVQLYAGHLICMDMPQGREREALLCNAEIVDVESPVEKFASFGSARLQYVYRLWGFGFNIQAKKAKFRRSFSNSPFTLVTAFVSSPFSIPE